MSAKTQLIPGTRPGESYGSFRVMTANPSQDGSLNLYCEGMSAPYGYLNLSLVGGTYSLENSLNLFLYNNTPEGTLNLFLRGEGGEPGATPIYGSLNLYIERPTDGALNLYCSGEMLPTAEGEFTTLVAWGGPGPRYGDFTTNVYSLTASLNLSMPYTNGNGIGNLNLYTHGF